MLLKKSSKYCSGRQFSNRLLVNTLRILSWTLLSIRSERQYIVTTVTFISQVIPEPTSTWGWSRCTRSSCESTTGWSESCSSSTPTGALTRCTRRPARSWAPSTRYDLRPRSKWLTCRLSRKKNACSVIQILTWEHYLPRVLGEEASSRLMPPYQGYDPVVDPSIANAFATAAFRFAHVTVQPVVSRLGPGYQVDSRHPPLPLHDSLFASWRVVTEGAVAEMEKQQGEIMLTCFVCCYCCCRLQAGSTPFCEVFCWPRPNCRPRVRWWWRSWRRGFSRLRVGCLWTLQRSTCRGAAITACQVTPPGWCAVRIFTSMYFVSGTFKITTFHCHHGWKFFGCFATSALANVIKWAFKMLWVFTGAAHCGWSNKQAANSRKWKMWLLKKFQIFSVPIFLLLNFLLFCSTGR